MTNRGSYSTNIRNRINKFKSLSLSAAITKFNTDYTNIHFWFYAEIPHIASHQRKQKDAKTNKKVIFETLTKQHNRVDTSRKAPKC